MKTANGVEKPLAEWTLKDLKKFKIEKCESLCCSECPIQTVCEDEIEDWNLEEKPKFTEQEIEDAKTLNRILPGGLYFIARKSDGDMIASFNFTTTGRSTLKLSQTSFDSLKKNETAYLIDIIGDADA